MIIANESIVALQGENVIIMNPRTVMTREQALNLAAWIVAIADREGEFNDTLRQVLNT